jgi:tetratricopeptide (TPR) repeat protein
MARVDLISILLGGILLAATADGFAYQSPGPDAKPCPDQVSDQPSSSDNSTKAKAKADQAAQPADTPCIPAKEPSPAQKFPFPGSSSAPPLPGSTPPPPVGVPSPAGHRPSAAEEHPFPGSAPPMPGSDAESSSSSSSSNDGSSNPNDSPSSAGDTPAGPDKTSSPRSLGRRRLPKVEKLQSDEDRVDEDLKVARFYENKGDLNAAYLRVRDAVKALPSDSESHYELARIAQKLNKQDEAIAEYSAYLKLEPDGLNIKQAQKALDQLHSK